MKKLPAKKKWHSLTQVRDYIVENHHDEVVISFVGYELVTNYAVYRMGPDGLSITSNEKDS